MKNLTKYSLFGVSIIFGGCSNLPEKPHLDPLQAAKSAYQQAHPTTTQAAAELAQAKQLLEAAERAQEAEEREKLVRLAQEKIRWSVAQQRPTEQVKPIEVNYDTEIQHLSDLLKEFSHQQTSQGWKLILNEENFAGGKTALLAATQRKLGRLAAFLKQNPTRQVLIEGYSQALSDYSLGLSQRQAQEVRFALLQRGIASNRIITAITGSKQRRIEIIILN